MSSSSESRPSGTSTTGSTSPSTSPCGTGLSRKALKQLATKIVGADVSAAMLEQADRDECIRYLVFPAEILPLADESFDLLTVFSAFHWFDRDAFRPEAHRVLKPRGWLVIYNNLFFANLHGNADFKSWITSGYVNRFPTPSRNNHPLDHQRADRSGFHLVKHESFTNVVFFNRQQLIDYLLTQTNVIAAVERGESTHDDIWTYLGTEIEPFFTSCEKHAFDFGGPVSNLRGADELKSAPASLKIGFEPYPAASAACRTSAGTP